MMSPFILAIVISALAFDYINGFHDTANAIATVVSTRVLSPGQAVAWAAFFSFMGCANLYVAMNYATDTWVKFKMFGFLGLMLVFVVLQSFYVSRHIQEES